MLRRCHVRCISVDMIFHYAGMWATELLTLSLHDALPILKGLVLGRSDRLGDGIIPFIAVGELRVDVENDAAEIEQAVAQDRKSTRLNSSHLVTSYAVC